MRLLKHEDVQIITTDITERKQAEEKIKKTSEEWKKTFNAISDFVYILDKDFRIVRVNKATCDILKKEPKELIGKRCFEVLHGTDEPWPNCPHKKTLVTKKATTEEISDPNLGLPLLVTTSPIFDDKGELIGSVHIAKDITKRKKAEEALRKSESKSRTLLENLPQKIFFKDKNSVYISCNENYARDLKIKSDEIAGKTDYDFFPKKLAGKWRAEDKKIMASGKAEDIDEEYIQDGQKVFVHKVKTPVKDENGNVVGILGIFWDTSKRKWAEEKIRKEKEFTLSLLKGLKEGFAVIDKEGKQILVNNELCKMTEYSEKELLNQKPPFKYWAKEGLKDINEAFEKTLRGVEGEYELIFKKKDGKRFIALVSPRKTVDSDGNTIFFATIKDITERKKAEETVRHYSEHLEELVEERTRELKESQERLIKSERLAAIGEAATMVGHDLRNPLQSIENATYYLNNELPHLSIPQKAVEMLQVINDSVNYADKIMRDLQDFSAPKKPVLKKTNINTIVKETLSQVETPENVELITELSHLPQIEADKDMIKRVFMNLAVNGIQAMKENGGTLKASTKKTKNFVVVSFKDAGIGLSKENMEKLFTPFFTTKAKGMGMGLPICNKFVEIHGGSIEVESEVGEGSTFTVKLPIKLENGGEKTW